MSVAEFGLSSMSLTFWTRLRDHEHSEATSRARKQSFAPNMEIEIRTRADVISSLRQMHLGARTTLD
ncbi:hypothetical protein B6S44_24090 [Bosea sp. Tri-44]|uniref:hypothetical protein n=1 Tax=Bosea sp. Tri-44 TaxID=1972137 RepID=UPI00100E3B38|nr:hypothetical protein [Bosea sp. Tri-44]RXT48152.1 hypothetical protein B6S44_24090 [Bosea sp. Tri-44]